MKEFTLNTLFNLIGAIIVAFALEGFLVPNNVIDGGIVGISIMASYLSKIDLGIFLVLLNLPFLILSLTEFGKKFAINAIVSVCFMSFFTTLFGKYLNPITNDFLLAAIFGGGILGIGVGIVLKNNACLDGTEILAIKISKTYPYSVGEIIMFFNVFIFTSAGFVFGWDKAMYSTLTYFVAYRSIDAVVQGLSEEKSVRIVSDKGQLIGQAIINDLGKTITYIEAQGGYTLNKKTMILCVVPRIELMKLKKLVNTLDENAFLVVENVHEVCGKRYKK